MKNDLVSIITPCYNSELYIEETINSVLKQSHNLIEFIVVDDGSADESLKILKKYKNYIKIIESKNLGANSARNLGFKNASGKFIMFLDSDDILEKNTIEILLKYQNGDDITVCNFDRLKNINGIWKRVPSGMSYLPPNKQELSSWLLGWYIPPCAVLWSKKSLIKAGKWDEKLTINQDGDIMLRAIIAGIKLIYTKGTKSLYRSFSKDKISTSSRINERHAIQSNMIVIEKIKSLLMQKGILGNFKNEIGYFYYRLARNNIVHNNDLALDCLNSSRKYIGNTNFGTPTHKILCFFLGLENKEIFAHRISKFGFGRKKRLIHNEIFKFFKLI